MIKPSRRPLALSVCVLCALVVEHCEASTIPAATSQIVFTGSSPVASFDSGNCRRSVVTSGGTTSSCQGFNQGAKGDVIFGTSSFTGTGSTTNQTASSALELESSGVSGVVTADTRFTYFVGIEQTAPLPVAPPFFFVPVDVTAAGSATGRAPGTTELTANISTNVVQANGVVNGFLADSQ